MVPSSPALSGDWPQWGGRPVRNMVSDEKGLPGSFDPPEKKADGQMPEMAKAASLVRSLRLGSETYGSPVIAGGRIFVGTNNGAPRNPRYDGDWGALTCIDASARGEGDRSATGKVWTYTGIDRRMATPSVAGGLVFATDYRGVIHCVDARTGERLWVHETKAMMMGSTLVADGKVYAGTETGKLMVFAAAREKRLLGEARLGSPMHCTPVAANGLLYIAAHKNLFVLGKP